MKRSHEKIYLNFLKIKKSLNNFNSLRTQIKKYLFNNIKIINHKN